MGVYEDNIIPIKISHLAEYVSRRKRISLDEALRIFLPMICTRNSIMRGPSGGTLVQKLSFHTQRVIDALQFVTSYEV